MAQRHRRWLVPVAFLLLAGLMTGIWFAGKNWPFRYRIMKPLLEDVFGCQISIQHYHRVYFPNPGFVADGMVLSRRTAPDQPPIGALQHLRVESHWSDVFLLRHRVQSVQVDGLHVVIPPSGSRASQEDFPPGSTSDFTGSDTPVQSMMFRNSLLEIQTQSSKVDFPIRQLHFENVRKGQAATFAVEMENALPNGHIRASGRFGPLNAGQLGATPLSGEFAFTNVQLRDVGDLHGTLRALGRFSGRLDQVTADATADTPDFAVDDAVPTPVQGAVHCRINGLNGDVYLDSIEARTGQTLIHATGQVAGSPKETHLDLRVAQGRVEDVMRPFLHRSVPVAGPVSIRAQAFIAPAGKQGFLDRLRVEGAFEVPAEKVTDRQTEKTLSSFSQRAQGHKPPDLSKDPGKAAEVPDAVSSLKGPALVSHGIVTTQGLTFEVPGATAQLDGTFNFQTTAVHLTGKLRTKADLSDDAGGWKSFLLAPLDPFFRHKHAGAIVSIAVTGTKDHYTVTQNVTHDK